MTASNRVNHHITSFRLVEFRCTPPPLMPVATVGSLTEKMHNSR